MRIARIIFVLFLAVGSLAMPVQSQAGVAVGISVRIGPPALPVYAQPICPGPDYIWTPGYWAYDYEDEDYYWVPGTWVIAPEPGLLWTPGYWGWNDGFYFWHAGYWGPVVGFYGGINYGFGYPGAGFYGGYWRGRQYFYNRSVTNVNVTVVHNTYNTTVVNNRTINRVSFNGGRGGISARPTSVELAAEHQRHVSMTSEQSRHTEAARNDRSFRASVNHGRPDVAATPRASEFRGRASIENSRVANSNRPPDNRVESNRVESSRPGRPVENNGRNFPDRPTTARSYNSAPNSALEQKHQREQDRMRQQQDAERQKIQQRHDQEQQSMEHQRVNQQRQDQLQRHQQQQDQLQRRQQQQMEQMNRRHEQQSQRMEQRQQRETQRQQEKPPKSGRQEHQ